MADYRLYFMDSKDHIRDAVDLDCVDDSEAIRQANAYAGQSMELWRRARVVMKFPASAPDSTAAAPISACGTSG